MLAEGSVLAAPDMQNAEDLVAKQERGTDHHPDAVLPQDRIRDRRRVDVVQAHRLPRCRDPTCEAHSERHTNALTNLLLNAARSSRDELIRPFVEHQHCDRVRIKYVLHALQQLAEQFVNIKRCQLPVGQSLKVRETLPSLTVREPPGISTPAQNARTGVFSPPLQAAQIVVGPLPYTAGSSTLAALSLRSCRDRPGGKSRL